MFGKALQICVGSQTGALSVIHGVTQTNVLRENKRLQRLTSWLALLSGPERRSGFRLPSRRVVNLQDRPRGRCLRALQRETASDPEVPSETRNRRVSAYIRPWLPRKHGGAEGGGRDGQTAGGGGTDGDGGRESFSRSTLQTQHFLPSHPPVKRV